MRETGPSPAPAGAVGANIRRLLNAAGDAVASILFPAACRICDSFLTRASRVPICDSCLQSFEGPPHARCEVCGRPLPALAPAADRNMVCPPCQQNTYAFDRARSFGIYQGALARAILLLKFEEMQPLGEWFAARMAQLVHREGAAMAADVVVPVPLHRQRQKERGYNQAALLSKPLARKLGLPHKALLLMRHRPRPDKQILSLAERWTSVRGAFATRPGSQVDKLRVLLVDDVLTTGATLDACSRALLDSGAKSVVGLTIARAAANLVIPGRKSSES